MQRRMAPEEKIKLSTFVKEWRELHEDGTQQQCAADAQKTMNFPDYNIRTFTIIPFWGAGVVSEYAKKKRAYTKRKEKDEEPGAGEQCDVLNDAPSLAGLIKKIQELEEYAHLLSGHQKKQLEKLFLA